MAAFRTRLPFLLAVALVAAALGDALVESISNSGLLGGGYADDNHSSVVPTLAAGALVALEFVRRRGADMLGRANAGPRTDWVVELARRYAPGSPLRDLPFIFALQLAALFAMESAEQLTFGGKLPGGTAWLGGPVLFSLLAHALIGAGCSMLLARFVRALLATFAELVRGALDFILMAAPRRASTFTSGRYGRTPQHRAQALHSRQSGKRAPPPHAFALA